MEFSLIGDTLSIGSDKTGSCFAASALMEFVAGSSFDVHDVVGSTTVQDNIELRELGSIQTV